MRGNNRVGNGKSEDQHKDEALLPEQELGSGSESLYAFYLPTYRRLAEINGEDRWLVNVGTTTGSVAALVGQHRASLPEAPTVALVVSTEDAAVLQRLVHMVLDLRGRRATSAGGPDWFLTNGEEIADIYRFAMGSSAEWPSSSVQAQDRSQPFEQEPDVSVDSPPALDESTEAPRTYWASVQNPLTSASGTGMPPSPADPFERLN